MLTVTLDGKTLFSREVESLDSTTTLAGIYELKATFEGGHSDSRQPKPPRLRSV